MDISEMLVLMGFVGACFLAAATGAAFPPGDWYERLAKPSWRPPNWLFGLLGRLRPDHCRFRMAAWRTAGLAGAGLPLAIYLAHLVLNAAWTPTSSGYTVQTWHSLKSCFAVLDRRDRGGFPSRQCSGCLAAVTLSSLGHLCCGAQLHSLAPQSRGSFTELASVRNLSTMTTGLSGPTDARQSPTGMSPDGSLADMLCCMKKRPLYP